MSVRKCSPESGTDMESSLALVNSNLILAPDSLDNGHGGHSAEPTLGCSQQGPVLGDKYLPVMTQGG